MNITISNNNLHFISIGDNMYLSDKVVTYDLWSALMPSDSIARFNTDQKPNFPIYGVKFQDVLLFIDLLNKEVNHEKYYFDIPHLLEWEKLFKDVEFIDLKSLNIDTYAWLHDNSLNRVHEVAQKKTILDFYDPIGNVMEWCYFKGSRFTYGKEDVQPAVGGSYDDSLEECFSPRYIGNGNEFNEVVGFRLGLFSKDLNR